MNTVFDIPENKEVCIVAEKGREKFAEDLMTLISAESDIKAGACSYNKYKDNLISSANYIIFLGNFPEKKKVHPTFRVIRQSCSAKSLSSKYRSSLNP